MTSTDPLADAMAAARRRTIADRRRHIGDQHARDLLALLITR